MLARSWAMRLYHHLSSSNSLFFEGGTFFSDTSEKVNLQGTSIKLLYILGTPTTSFLGVFFFFESSVVNMGNMSESRRAGAPKTRLFQEDHTSQGGLAQKNHNVGNLMNQSRPHQFRIRYPGCFVTGALMSKSRSHCCMKENQHLSGFLQCGEM